MVRLLALALAASPVAAQAGGWLAGQINTTMCYWERPRAAVVRDMVYVDGGDLWWKPGMADGTYGGLVNDENAAGVVFTLNLSVAYATTTAGNVTAAMGLLYKVAAGTSANNRAPNYVDGAMLANNAEWFLYGGLVADSDAYAMPAADAVLAYLADQYGAYKAAFRPGFVDAVLPAGNLTRYIAYGGAASAPSENKAWYFSGQRSPSWGPIYQVSGNDSLAAVNGSRTLVELDMAVQQAETWANLTLPSDVRPRANPSLVWVPVGSHGLLVALGGVTYPEYASVLAESEDPAASEAQSPAFLTTVDVYDVAARAWYRQPTTGAAALGQRARACAVVATAADASSFNIYYYGGFDGLDVSAAFDDDVWVLSLPSFTWTRVSSGTTAHARAGHQCLMPYPDQMLVVGGYTPQGDDVPACLDGGVVQVFNLSSARWLSAYDPTRWSEYRVPDAVVSVIGGRPDGGATATAPAASDGWADPSLEAVFATPYATAKITTYYPYPEASSTTSSTTTGTGGPNPAPTNTHSGSDLPAFVAPVVGVVGGLVVLTALALLFILYRRRRVLYGSTTGRRSSHGTGLDGTGAGAESVATYDTSRNFVFSWLRAQPSVKHASTVTTSYDEPRGPSPNDPSVSASTAAYAVTPSTSPAMAQINHCPYSPRDSASPQSTVAVAPAEVENNYIAEMMADTTYRSGLPAELPCEKSLADASSRPAVASAELESPIINSSIAGASDTASSRGNVRSTHAPTPPIPQQQAAASASARPDSLSLGQPPQPWSGPQAAAARSATPVSPATAARSRESAVSDLSEQDRRHLRHGSEGGQSSASGVSSVAAASTVSPLGTVFPSSPAQPQPIPEATAGAEAAAEAAAARAYRPQSPSQTIASTDMRKSVFHESREDMRE